ncbi:MAG: nucleotidyl transferase AbiEii/AbiGii toxin family protein [Vulcanimicrobiota bacterium]
MIDLLKNTVKDSRDREEKQNRTREFLQVLILKILFDNNSFRNLAFQGGTALRILFDLRRFSEDLDFSLIHSDGYSASSLVDLFQRVFSVYGLPCELRLKDDRTVQQLDFRFSTVLQKMGLSSQKGQRLLIKMEIDTSPPAGWRTALSLVSRYFIFSVCHFDLPSLFATKLHACFFRKYTKGRDFYDFLWYLGRRIEPEFALLNNAIEQTEKYNPGIDRAHFRDFLEEKLSHIDYNVVKKDLAPFVEDRSELILFDKEHMLEMVKSLPQ